MTQDKYSDILESPSIVELTRVFRVLTDIRISVFPADSNIEDSLEGLARQDGACGLLLANPATRRECRRFAREGRKQLQGRRSPLVLYCKFGLVRVVAPVRANGRREGSLVTEALRLEDAKTHHLEEWRNKEGIRSNFDETTEEAHNALLRDTVVVNRNELEALVVLLAHLAANVADYVHHQQLQTHYSEPREIREAKEMVISSHNGLSTSEAAKRIGLSCQHFCRIFKQHTGMTFQGFVARTRIERAKKLLLDPDLRITEVAFNSGFESIPHFNRTFRKLVGTNPQTYRRSCVIRGDQ